MSTFKEVQDQLLRAESKAAIYQHIIDHLESSFLPQGESSAKNRLLLETKVPVSDAMFSEVVTEMSYGLSVVIAEKARILGSEVRQTVAPTQQVAPQGEVKS